MFTFCFGMVTYYCFGLMTCVDATRKQIPNRIASTKQHIYFICCRHYNGYTHVSPYHFCLVIVYTNLYKCFVCFIYSIMGLTLWNKRVVEMNLAKFEFEIVAGPWAHSGHVRLAHVAWAYVPIRRGLTRP